MSEHDPNMHDSIRRYISIMLDFPPPIRDPEWEEENKIIGLLLNFYTKIMKRLLVDWLRNYAKIIDPSYGIGAAYIISFYE